MATSKRSRRRKMRVCILASIFPVRPRSQSSAKPLLLKLPITSQCKLPDDQCQQLAYITAKLHPPRHRPRIAALQIPVARQRPEREEFRVAVVAQIEHARKTRAGIVLFVPETVAALRGGEIFYAARHRRMIDLARGHEAEQRPRRLRGRRRRF